MTKTYITTDWRIIQNLQDRYNNAERHPLPLDQLVGQVKNMDVTEYLRLFPNNSIDFIFTDELYGQAKTRINFKARKNMTTDFEWDTMPELPDFFDDLTIDVLGGDMRLPTHVYTEWVFEAARALKPHGILMNFGVSQYTSAFRDILSVAGLTWRASGPWIKTNPAPSVRKSNLTSSYEMFFIASKGTIKGYINFQEQMEMLNHMLDTKCPNCGVIHPVHFSNQYDEPEWYSKVEEWDLYEIAPLNSKKATMHETEKPAWILNKYIQIFSNPGELVVDPFGGSGGTAYVADSLGRQWATNDLSPEWVAVIKKRMESKLQNLV